METQAPHIPATTPPKKQRSFRRLFKRIFLSLLISLVALLGICVALVYIYEDDVKRLIITELNKHLQSEIRVQPEDIDLTVIRSFPQCGLEFKNVDAMEATKEPNKDTLFHAGTIRLSFSLVDLFNKNYAIRQILVSDASFNLNVDKAGKANYILWKTADAGTGSSDSVRFSLEKIILKNAVLSYKNAKAKVRLQTHINRIEFKGRFNEAQYDMAAQGEATIDQLQVQKIRYINDKRLTFAMDIGVNGPEFRFREANVQLNKMALKAKGSLRYKDSLQALNLNYEGKNLEIASVLSLLPEKAKSNISDYSSDGLFYANGTLDYTAGSPLQTHSDFGIKQATITYKPQSTKLHNLNLTGRLDISGKSSRLALRNISANLGNNTFSGDCDIANFNDPYLSIHADVNTNLEELIGFYPIDTIQSLSGNLRLNASIEGLLSELRKSAYAPTVKADGSASIQQLKIRFKHAENELHVSEGELKLNNRSLNVYNLKLLHGHSDLSLVGTMPDFLNYVFNPSAPLSIQAQLSSANIALEDFMGSSAGSGVSTSTLNIPANLDFNLDASIAKLSFGKFNASQLKGTVYIKDQKLFVKNLELETMDGKASLNAFADASGDNIRISAESELKGINIKKLFEQFNNFGQTTLQDKHLKGFATASIDFSGVWSKQLRADLSALNVTSSLLIERGELNDFKPLESLGRFIDVKELQHIKFSTLQSAVEIRNKVISIPRTSIKSSAINIELWGKHGFDNVVEYHFQLLLSELLSRKPRANKEFDEELSLVENDPENRRSVFIIMSGPIDHPTFKYDRKSAKEKIRQDIKQEKQNLKTILKEEFGFFKKDTTQAKKPGVLQEQKFRLEPATGNKKEQPTLQPKKKEEDDDDF